MKKVFHEANRRYFGSSTLNTSGNGINENKVMRRIRCFAILCTLAAVSFLSSCANNGNLAMSKVNKEIETTVVDIEGQKINYTLSGNGKLSIIFLNGHRTPLKNWSEVIPRVSGMGTVLAYDRLDTGGSGKSSNPQDGDAILSTLNTLLEAVDVAPPYILVAHSLGGLYANLYARRYPEKTGSVVFVEAGHPGEAHEYSEQQKPNSGLFGKLLRVFTPEFKKNPNSEYNNVDATVSQIESAPEFPNINVAIITGGKKMPFVPEEAFNTHLEWQKKLAELGLSGYQVIAEKSGHTPQISEPDIVVQVIAKAVDALKQ